VVEQTSSDLHSPDRKIETAKKSGLPQPTKTCKRITVPAVWETWRTTWEGVHASEHNSGLRKCLEWSKKERGQVKHMIKRWPRADGGAAFHDFIAWTIINWPRIIATHFDWMKKPRAPEQPNIGFVVRFYPEIASAWCDRRVTEWLMATDRTQMEHYVGTGMTEDEALFQVAKDTALAMDREQREKDKAYVARMYRVVAIAKQKMERMPVYTRDNPHPQSETAKRARGEIIDPPSMNHLTTEEAERDRDFSNIDFPAWEDD
jgi:hypothetical protein